MGRAALAITLPGKNTTKLQTFPVQQLDHRRKFAHNIPLILLILLILRFGGYTPEGIVDRGYTHGSATAQN
ncbi:MAG: hypothetical protein ACI9DH_001222 [Halioglobus sp.]|jgi:hypothetical protein